MCHSLRPNFIWHSFRFSQAKKNDLFLISYSLTMDFPFYHQWNDLYQYKYLWLIYIRSCGNFHSSSNSLLRQHLRLYLTEGEGSISFLGLLKVDSPWSNKWYDDNYQLAFICAIKRKGFILQLIVTQTHTHFAPMTNIWYLFDLKFIYLGKDQHRQSIDLPVTESSQHTIETIVFIDDHVLRYRQKLYGWWRRNNRVNNILPERELKLLKRLSVTGQQSMLFPLQQGMKKFGTCSTPWADIAKRNITKMVRLILFVILEAIS